MKQDALTPEHLRKTVVAYDTREAPGTIVIDTGNTYLYYVLGQGRAIRYGVGVGREGFTWSGVHTISRKAEWPDWIPPAEMIARQPYLPRWIAAVPAIRSARAPCISVRASIAFTAPTIRPRSASSSPVGCIRMTNDDVIDLFGRVNIGTKVVVLPKTQRRNLDAYAAMPAREISQPQPATSGARRRYFRNVLNRLKTMRVPLSTRHPFRPCRRRRDRRHEQRRAECACARFLLVVLQHADRPARAAFATGTRLQQPVTRSFRRRRRRKPPSSGGGRSTAYCVRTCDGRYFPISASNEQSRAATCSSLCPASETKVYYGSSIDDATSESGKPYSSLPNAFKYREQLVSGCTCNGKDSVGLASISIDDDKTLRRGDIVAGENGLIVANRAGRQEARRRRRFHSRTAKRPREVRTVARHDAHVDEPHVRL